MLVVKQELRTQSMGQKINNNKCLCHSSLANEASMLLGELANSERLMIVALLHELGEMHVNALVEILGAPRASLSRHLGRLRDQSIVTTRRKHNRIYYTLNHAKTAALVKSIGNVLG